MARNHETHVSLCLLIQNAQHQYLQQIFVLLDLLHKIAKRKRKHSETVQPYCIIDRIPDQVKHLHRMVGVTDTDCVVNLRMDRNTFGRLCILLREIGGLRDGKYVSVEEQVAMFLGILAHHKKNRIIKFDFWRSGQTVSHYVHVVLKSVLKLHGLLLVKPEPVPDDCTDSRWKWFKGCLGELDGTYINVMVPLLDKPRYRTRKGHICTNTLAVCDRNLRFVYVLSGWEGSAGDSRVLRDAVNRVNGLKVPRGKYYLCDNGYANSEGFLTPYKGVRYHLKEWGPDKQCPENAREMFNMRHTKARNVIERAFGIMKMRWGILRSATYYPIKVQNRLIMACFLLHNFIRTEMELDPIEQDWDDIGHQNDDDVEPQDVEYVDVVESSSEWNRWRDDLATSMWEN